MLDVCKLYELMDEKSVKSVKLLSRETKIPYNTLIYMINGHDMHVSTIVELSKFFDVPVDYLINKSYGIEVVDENSYRLVNRSSLIETTVLEMM